MNKQIQNSYIASPYWRWRDISCLHVSHPFLPKRENHDTFKIITKSA